MVVSFLLLARGRAGAQAPITAPPWATAAAPLVLRGVTVIDVRQGRRLRHQAVTVIGNRIRRIEPDTGARVPAGARVVDARGRYLIPGLWDLHVHPQNYVDLVYPLLLANGVTGMRDAGSRVPLATLNRWKQEIAAGTRVGPRVLVSGPAILQAPDSQTIITPLSHRNSHAILVPRALARWVVDSLAARGADFIKTYKMSPGMRMVIADEARRRGIPWGGHSADTSGLASSDLGATFLDHEPWLQPDVCRVGAPAFSFAACGRAARHLRRNHTWITIGSTAIAATLFPGHVAQRVRRFQPDSFTMGAGFDALMARADSLAATEHWPTSTAAWERAARQSTEWSLGGNQLDSVRRQTAQLRAAGPLPYVIGTDPMLVESLFDYGSTPGFLTHEAMEMLVVQGWTPLEVLQMATLNPALALRALDSLGTVSAGKLADLVLLDADPLADIWNTTKIQGVVANGRYYDRAALDRLLAAAAQAARTAPPPPRDP